jgi:hypothetical protein
MSKARWPDWEIYVQYGCVCVYCGFDGTTDPLVGYVNERRSPPGSAMSSPARRLTRMLEPSLFQHELSRQRRV